MRIIRGYIADEELLCVLITILICIYSTVVIMGVRKSAAIQDTSGTSSVLILNPETQNKFDCTYYTTKGIAEKTN